jgi:hypothetical protein
MSSTAAAGSTSGAPPPNCPNFADAGALPLQDCPPGQVEILGQIVNYCAGTPVSSGLTLTDILDPSLLIRADSCGVFHSCTPPKTQLRVQIDSPFFAATSLPVAEPVVSSELTIPLVLVCDQLYTGLVEQLASGTPYDPDGGGLFIVTLAQAPSGRCADPSGWQFQAVDRNGDPVPSSIAYITAVGVDTQATATTLVGVAILYNIDPAYDIVQVQGIDAYADGGASECNVSAPYPPLTGSFPADRGRFTDVLWPVY